MSARELEPGVRLTLGDSPSDFGAYLRAAREQRGIPLQEIAAATKISLIVLEALERNDTARLPGGIFTRSFVRAYARQVGLDPEAAVRELVARFPDTSPDQDTGYRAPAPGEIGVDRSSAWFGRTARVLGVGIPVLLVGLYFAVGARLWRAGAPPPAQVQAPSAAPVERTETPDATRAGTPVVTGAPAPPASGIGVPQAGPAEVLVLRLVSRDWCWVQVEIDDGPASEMLLRPGEVQDLRARDHVVLKIGNAGAVDITINGAPIRALGGPGQVVAIRIDRQNYKSYLATSGEPTG